MCFPRKKNMFSATRLYKIAKFPRALQPAVRKLISDFNASVAPTVAKIVANGERCGRQVFKSTKGGRGLRTSKGVPARTTILCYPGTLQPREKHRGSQRYLFEMSPINFAGKDRRKREVIIECVVDGKPALDALDTAPAEEAERKLQCVNAALHNHSCLGHNVYATEVRDVSTGVPYIVYATGKRAIPPGNEILSDYNKGKTRSKYWRSAKAVLAEGCPESKLVRCLCKSSLPKKKKRCPYDRAFDNRLMSGGA